MKTYNEILKEIEKASRELNTIEEKKKTISEKIYNAPDFLTRKEIRKDHFSELAKLEEKTTDKKITIKLLKNNARVALFNEITPIIAEVFNNYIGKPYGEKTRQKISNEIFNRIACRCYIYAEYLHSQRFEIYSGSNDYNITIGYPGNSELKLLEDNKIQAVEPEKLQLYYIKSTYFEDIPGAIKEMKKAYKKAVEKQNELEKICDSFNFYAVDGIKSIYKDKPIYKNFTI